MAVPRVALFSDSYDETNGAALSTRAVERYARARGFPVLCVHGRASDSEATDIGPSGGQLALRRGAASFRLDHDLRYDPFLWRHARRVASSVRAFAPDLIHVTGPSDVGQLGAWVAYRLGVPLVGTWHTNLHHWAARRVLRRLPWLSRRAGLAARFFIERHALRAALWFYQVPRVLLAPNEDLVQLLASRTGKPVFLMARGVDLELFSPGRRREHPQELRIGFVGRLNADKGVRQLAAVERAVAEAVDLRVRLIVIGEGRERRWLEEHLRHAEFPGLVQGASLAQAYADMDLFVFPSEIETFASAILEALASGVPVVTMARGGTKFLVEHGRSGILAHDEDSLIEAVVTLARDRETRERMGRQARAQALGYAWDSVCASLYEVYAGATTSRALPTLQVTSAQA
jgi:glycosyltransferase involved in cell wall biosynthesis